MRAQRLSGLGLLLVVLTMTGCGSSLEEQNAHLMEENTALRAQLVDRNGALESAREELRDRDGRLADLRRQLDAAQVPPDTDPFGGIAGVTGSYRNGEVTASVASDVLFDAGQAKLKSTAKRSLDQVASILKSDYGGRVIRVEGHTDTDPIRKSGFKSNHHLGFERAYAVRAYLVERGISADRVFIASFGPDRAKSSKKDSRRVEIAVVLNET